MSSNETFNLKDLLTVINSATAEVKKQLDVINKAGDEVGIGDMFTMQMLMNKLSQLSEMTTSVIAASNTSLMSMARNIK
jgi:Family of unknown function (DUF5407)